MTIWSVCLVIWKKQLRMFCKPDFESNNDVGGLYDLLNIREEGGSVSFKVRVLPRASRNQLAGLYEDAVKIRLAAPPVEGKANEVLRSFIAELLSVSRSHVEIVSGLTGRNKLIRVTGVSAEKVLEVFLV